MEGGSKGERERGRERESERERNKDRVGKERRAKK